MPLDAGDAALAGLTFSALPPAGAVSPATSLAVTSMVAYGRLTPVSTGREGLEPGLSLLAMGRH
jgi:hypothetical protein